MVSVTAWSGLLHGLGYCMVWVTAWSGLLHGLGYCMVWVTAWSGLLHGLGYCMVWVTAWPLLLHGLGYCMVWVTAWSNRVEENFVIYAVLPFMQWYSSWHNTKYHVDISFLLKYYFTFMVKIYLKWSSSVHMYIYFQRIDINKFSPQRLDAIL